MKRYVLGKQRTYSTLNSQRKWLGKEQGAYSSLNSDNKIEEPHKIIRGISAHVVMSTTEVTRNVDAHSSSLLTQYKEMHIHYYALKENLHIQIRKEVEHF